ncbi:MAG: hypothetical protein K2O09_03025 [Treponemataceae bacterium]|nr:hypothetical protein [Treponemataceae bacterium]
MKKSFVIWMTFLTLTLTAIYFTACGDGNWSNRAIYVSLTGSTTGYRISSARYNASVFFSKGYMYHKEHGIEITSNNEKEGAAAEFKITGGSLRIEIYEGQTLPTGEHIYVYSGRDGQGERIGKIVITKTDDKLTFEYKERENDYW